MEVQMTVQTDFLKRCKALNLHDGKLSDWLDEIESLRQQLAAAYEAGKRDASEDLEQAAFEKWLHDKCPSGDVESVQRQWLKSYEYAEFAGELEQAAEAADEIESLRQQLTELLNWQQKAFAAHPNIDIDIDRMN
jgi:hypothetical protein